MVTVIKDRTILVVEDNPDHLGLIKAVVSRGIRGAEVRVALLCEGARRFLRGDWSAYDDDSQANPLPDVIVLDLWLPDGSGFELLEWISSRHWLQNIPLIVFTASMDPTHAQAAKDLGVKRYLQKPAHFGSLVEAIKEEMHAADIRKAGGEEQQSAGL